MNNLAGFANVILSTTPNQLFKIGCTSCPYTGYLYETCAKANMGEYCSQESIRHQPQSIHAIVLKGLCIVFTCVQHFFCG